MGNFIDRCSRSFFQGLFWGAGIFVAYVIYGALSTAFWYYVATTAMDYSEDSKYDREIQLIHYPEGEHYDSDNRELGKGLDRRSGDRWTPCDEDPLRCDYDLRDWIDEALRAEPDTGTD
jgi:hypothetical protein